MSRRAAEEVSPRQRPAWVVRVIVCVLIAVVGGHYAWFETFARPIHPDIGQIWFAARAVLHGQNPYALIGPGRAYEWGAPLFYPLPAALVAIPLTPFSLSLATGLFVALGVGVFAWALTAEGYGGLFALTSICIHQAMQIAQWAPLVAGAMVLAPLSVILIAKPTLGVAVFAARPSRWAIDGGLLLIAISFLVQPHWVTAWREALSAASVGAGKPFPYTAPVTFPGGALTLLALLRWKRPEARLLAVLACVPQTMLPYEGVLLFLVPRGWRQSLGLSVLSWLMVVYVRTVYAPVGLLGTIEAYGPMMTLFLYLPATIMVLRRPNEGTVPAGLEERLARAHGWRRSATKRAVQS